MAYTEVKEINGKKYYYRVRTIREGRRFRKQRIYLGKNLSINRLIIKEIDADKKLNIKKRNKTLDEIIPKIRHILKINKIKRAGIFGSYALGKQKKESDIDILVEPPEGIGFGFAGIQLELEDKLKKKVDLVSYNGISPYIKKKILSQEIKILWKMI